MVDERHFRLALLLVVCMALSASFVRAESTREWPISSIAKVYIAASDDMAFVLAAEPQGATLRQFSVSQPEQQLYAGDFYPLGLALSPDGRQMLITYHHDDGLRITQLAIRKGKAERVAEFSKGDPWARKDAWSRDGKRWLSIAGSHLTLHESNGRQIPLHAISGTRTESHDVAEKATILFAWPVVGERAAYALTADGQLFKSNARQARLLLTLSNEVHSWNYAETEHTLFVLAEDAMYRISLGSLTVEKKSLQAYSRELAQGENCATIYTLRAVDNDVVAIAVNPSPANLAGIDEKEFGQFLYDHPGGIYLLRFSQLKLERVLSLEHQMDGSGRDLCLGDDLTFAIAKHGLWAVVVDVTNQGDSYKVMYNPLPPI